jgi:hypothetical protein
VQCLHPAPSGPCLVVDRPARVDLLVAAGWNQAPARPAHECMVDASCRRALLRLSAIRLDLVTVVRDDRGQPKDLG